MEYDFKKENKEFKKEIQGALSMMTVEVSNQVKAVKEIGVVSDIKLNVSIPNSRLLNG